MIKAVSNNEVVVLNEVPSGADIASEQITEYNDKKYFNPVGAIIVPDITDKPSPYHEWINKAWVLNLEAAKADKLEHFREIPKQYIYSKYDDGEQLSLLKLKVDGTETQKSMCNQIDNWINQVLADYYNRRGQMQAATSLEELEAVSRDFSNNDASKPDIELSNILQAG